MSTEHGIMIGLEGERFEVRGSLVQSVLVLLAAVGQAVILQELSLKLLLRGMLLLAAGFVASSVDEVEFRATEIRVTRRAFGIRTRKRLAVTQPVRWTCSQQWYYRSARVLEFEGAGEFLGVNLSLARKTDVRELMAAVRAASTVE
jgi:hypothetical protein